MCGARAIAHGVISRDETLFSFEAGERSCCIFVFQKPIPNTARVQPPKRRTAWRQIIGLSLVDSLGVSIGREDRWERFRHARMDAFRCGMWMQNKNASAHFFSGGRRPRRSERTPTQPKFAAALLYQPQTWCTRRREYIMPIIEG